MRRLSATLAAVLLFATLTACGEPLKCTEGQHVEDHGYYQTSYYMVGKVMMPSTHWVRVEVCVAN